VASNWRRVHEVGSRCRDDRDTETLEHVMPGELHGEVTCEPIGRLHNDRLCAVGCQLLQHFGKAGALIDRIGTAHGCIVVFANDRESCLLGERLDGRSPKREREGRCEGRKPLSETRPEVVALARSLRRRRPKAGQLSLRDVSKELAARGFLNELGKPYAAKSVASMMR
jgi:hypothetical protein